MPVEGPPLMTEEILKLDPLSSKERQRDRELEPKAHSENGHAQSQSTSIRSLVVRRPEAQIGESAYPVSPIGNFGTLM